MIVQFQKHSDKPSTLTCLREDGTSTWTKIHPGLEIHDLAHYAVETVLGFNNAFYGMVARGTDIGDYSIPRERRPQEVMPANLSAEALQTEHLVNLLQISFSGADDQLNIISTLHTVLAENELTFPIQLTEETLELIHRQLSKLMAEWNALESGATMQLTFGSE